MVEATNNLVSAGSTAGPKGICVTTRVSIHTCFVPVFVLLTLEFLVGAVTLIPMIATVPISVTLIPMIATVPISLKSIPPTLRYLQYQ